MRVRAPFDRHAGRRHPVRGLRTCAQIRLMFFLVRPVVPRCACLFKRRDKTMCVKVTILPFLCCARHELLALKMKSLQLSLIALMLWLIAESSQRSSIVFPLIAIALALLLWLCTAMIYACLKFIREWSHPLTIVNYVLLGLASGLLLTAALAVLTGDPRYAIACSQWGVALTALALAVRSASLIRNARLRPVSTLQSATGIRAPKLKQMSMGMSAGAFNTREFFHGKSLGFVRYVKALFVALAFALPIVLVLISIAAQSGVTLFAAVAVQYLGLLGGGISFGPVSALTPWP